MYKVLVIEDEPAFRIMLNDTLSKDGFEVSLASNGKMGMIEAAKNLPDFILLDLMMPIMNGTAFLSHTNSVKGLSDVPVAVLTVVPDGVPQSLQGENLFKQVIGYWIKDVLTPKKITQKVRDYLNSQSDMKMAERASL